MHRIGYDTFGPEYPPEWDEVRIVRCAVCGREFPEDECIIDIVYGQKGWVCPDCVREGGYEDDGDD